MTLRTYHRIAGIVVFVVFLGTGMYMRLVYPGMAGVDSAQRIFFRSRHIYILAAALVHLSLGAYMPEGKARRSLRAIASALVTVSAVLLITAFFTEKAVLVPNVPVSAFGLFSLAAGVLLHLIAGSSHAKRFEVE